MGQNYPFMNNAGALPAQLQPQGPNPAGGQVGAPAQAPVAPGGMDASLQAKLASMLQQDPNAGDVFNVLAQGGMPNPAAGMPGVAGAPGAPGSGMEKFAKFAEAMSPGSPTDMLMGGAVGAGIGVGLQALQSGDTPVKIAEAIDKFPGAQRLGKWIDGKVMPWLSERPWGREFFLTDLVREGSGDTATSVFGEKAQERIQEQLKAHLAAIPKDGKTAEEIAKLHSIAERKFHEQAVQQTIGQMQRDHIERLIKPWENPKQGNGFVRAMRRLTGRPATPRNLTEQERNFIKALKEEQTFEGFVKKADGELEALKDAQKDARSSYKNLGFWERRRAIKADRRAYRLLMGMRNRARGFKNFYLPMYSQQATHTYALQRKGVSATGRGFANFQHAISRVFAGSTLVDSFAPMINGLKNMATGQAGKAGESKVTKVAGEAAGKGLKDILKKCGMLAIPFVTGMMIMGQSFKKAREAQNEPGDGPIRNEKVKTFFHDFFGTGLGMFIGWETGRKLLNSTFFADKIMPRVQSLPFLRRFSVGGIVTELVAMFIIASLVEKPLAGIAHLIFGKPKKESIEDAPQSGAQVPGGLPGLPGANPALPGVAQLPGLQGGQAPAQGAGLQGFPGFPAASASGPAVSVSGFGPQAQQPMPGSASPLTHGARYQKLINGGANPGMAAPATPRSSAQPFGPMPEAPVSMPQAAPAPLSGTTPTPDMIRKPFVGTNQ